MTRTKKIISSALLGTMLATEIFSIPVSASSAETLNFDATTPSSKLFQAPVNTSVSNSNLDEVQVDNASLIKTAQVSIDSEKPKAESLEDQKNLALDAFNALSPEAQKAFITQIQNQVQQRANGDRKYFNMLVNGLATAADYVVDTSVRTTLAALAASAGATGGIYAGLWATPHILPYIFNPWVVSLAAPMAAPCLGIAAGFIFMFEGAKLGWHLGGPVYQSVLKPTAYAAGWLGYKTAEYSAKASYYATSQVASYGASAAGKALALGLSAAKSSWSSVANSAWGWFNKAKNEQAQEETTALELNDVVDSQLTKSMKMDNSIMMNSIRSSMISSHPLSQAMILDDAEANDLRAQVNSSMAAAAA